MWGLNLFGHNPQTPFFWQPLCMAKAPEGIHSGAERFVELSQASLFDIKAPLKGVHFLPPFELRPLPAAAKQPRFPRFGYEIRGQESIRLSSLPEG